MAAGFSKIWSVVATQATTRRRRRMSVRSHQYTPTDTHSCRNSVGSRNRRCSHVHRWGRDRRCASHSTHTFRPQQGFRQSLPYLQFMLEHSKLSDRPLCLLPGTIEDIWLSEVSTVFDRRQVAVFVPIICVLYSALAHPFNDVLDSGSDRGGPVGTGSEID